MLNVTKELENWDRTFFDREPSDRGKVPNLHNIGWNLNKCHHVFGFAPTYVNSDGEIIFYHQREFMTGSEVVADLMELWRPVKEEERNWMILDMEKYFKG